MSLLLALQSVPRWTDCSFWHASPHLWNKLPVSLRQPCLNQSFSPSSPSSSPLVVIHHTCTLSSKLELWFPKIFSAVDTHTLQLDWLHGRLAVSVFHLLGGFFLVLILFIFLVYCVVRLTKLAACPLFECTLISFIIEYHIWDLHNFHTKYPAGRSG